MDPIVQGLLLNNLVDIEYISIGKFPTKGLMTKNLRFMYHEDSMEFGSGDFFQAYDILRRRKVTLLNEEDILGIVVFNPDSRDPLDLCKGICIPEHDCRSRAVKRFRESCGTATNAGDPMLLTDEEKRVFVDFFTGMNLSHFSEKELDECVEDLTYMSGEARLVDGLTYGVFFGCDMDFESETEALSYAAQRWISLVSVYRSLSLQRPKDNADSEEEQVNSASIRSGQSLSIEAIKAMKFPDPQSFKSYDQIMS